MELNQERIENAIISEVADKLIGNDALYERAKRAVDARIDMIFKEVADAQIRNAVEAAVSAGFEKTYQKVGSFGTAEGPPTTIRAELERLINGYWNEQVGKDGKPATYNTVTRAEWMMTQLVAADFKGEMKQHVVNLCGSLKDGLRAELYQTVNRLLSDVFRVRSTDDQGARSNGTNTIDPPQTVRA